MQLRIYIKIFLHQVGYLVLGCQFYRVIVGDYSTKIHELKPRWMNMF